MDFNYAKFPVVNPKTKRVIDYIYRPIIKIGVRKESNGSKADFLDYDVLIDSGADDCLFPIELAEIANIPLDENRSKNFHGVGGGITIGYPAPVVLNLGGHQVSTKVYFAPKLVGWGILGQVGFFDKFRVRFIYSKKRIEITED